MERICCLLRWALTKMDLSFENGHLNQTDRAIYCVFLQVTKFRVTASLYIHTSHRPTGTMTAVVFNNYGI